VLRVVCSGGGTDVGTRVGTTDRCRVRGVLGHNRCQRVLVLFRANVASIGPLRAVLCVQGPSDARELLVALVEDSSVPRGPAPTLPVRSV
jgi:hypothetical protein